MVCRNKSRRPQGFSERPFKSAYDMVLGKLGIGGKDKKAILNDFALWTAAVVGLGAGLLAGMVVGQALGVTVAVGAGIVAGSVAWSYAAEALAKGRYWRP